MSWSCHSNFRGKSIHAIVYFVLWKTDLGLPMRYYLTYYVLKSDFRMFWFFLVFLISPSDFSWSCCLYSCTCLFFVFKLMLRAACSTVESWLWSLIDHVVLNLFCWKIWTPLVLVANPLIDTEPPLPWLPSLLVLFVCSGSDGRSTYLVRGRFVYS